MVTYKEEFSMCGILDLEMIAKGWVENFLSVTKGAVLTSAGQKPSWHSKGTSHIHEFKVQSSPSSLCLQHQVSSQVQARGG